MSYGGTFVIFSKNMNWIGIQSFETGPLWEFKKQSFAWGTDLESIADKVFLESVDQETETLGTLKLK